MLGGPFADTIRQKAGSTLLGGVTSSMRIRMSGWSYQMLQLSFLRLLSDILDDVFVENLHSEAKSQTWHSQINLRVG